MTEPPWNHTPESIEDMLLALLDMEHHERKTGKPVSMHDAPILTRLLFKDIGTRILRLEQMWGLNETD